MSGLGRKAWPHILVPQVVTHKQSELQRASPPLPQKQLFRTCLAHARVHVGHGQRLSSRVQLGQHSSQCHALDALLLRSAQPQVQGEAMAPQLVEQAAWVWEAAGCGVCQH